jgi:hypothetical protein
MSGKPLPWKRAVWKKIRALMVGAEGTSGAVLAEFALFVPVVAVMAVYTIDFGLLIFNKMQV